MDNDANPSSDKQGLAVAVRPAFLYVFFTLLYALTPLSFAKDDVTTPAKPHTRTTMKTNAETIFQREADEQPWRDISSQKERHSFVAVGKIDRYEGHPTTVRLPGTDTVFCVWCAPHGGRGGQLARSDNGGKTWYRIDHLLPFEASRQWNCPSIYRLVDPQGKARIWIYSAWLGDTKQEHLGAMPSIMSEGDGQTWKAMPPLGLEFRNIMTFSAILPLKDGRYMGFYHRGPALDDEPTLEVCSAITADGGFTWSSPVVIGRIDGKNLCEPFALRSDNGDEITVLMRENNRIGYSMMMFSRDEGQTWTQPVDTGWALTGDRHSGVRLPDGRWVLCFRDTAKCSPTQGHFIAWIGTYDDIKNRRPGLRVKLLHSYAGWDCGYPGVELLDDGTILATTYIKYWNDARQQSVVSVRFRPDEFR